MPGHIVVVDAVMFIVGVMEGGLTVTVMAFDVADAGLAQPIDEVITTETTSPLFRGLAW